MVYKCLRCGQSSSNKHDIKKHLQRKNVCKPVLVDINIENCMKVLMGNDKDLCIELYEKEIHKLKQVNVLQEIQLENNKLKETIKNMKDEINQLKLNQIHVTEEQSECIYLLLEREFVNNPLKVAKIGRSVCFKNRMRNYPKGSKILCVSKCNDSVKSETDLLILFNVMFKHRSDVGDEYFEGDTSQMIKQIHGYFYNKM
jgi:hypothetical protein